VARVTERMLSLLPVARVTGLLDGPITIDLDTTDVEVYGSKKHGVEYNHHGQRCGRPQVATWAETEITLAAELFSGADDARASASDWLLRALAALPKRARAGRRVAVRVDAGYFAGELARVAHLEAISFAVGAKRIAPLWLLLGGLAEDEGPTRSTWTVRRPRWPITGPTGGPQPPTA
jgi:DDE family transposase